MRVCMRVCVCVRERERDIYKLIVGEYSGFQMNYLSVRQNFGGKFCFTGARLVSYTHIHTHTHTYIYIYIYIC